MSSSKWEIDWCGKDKKEVGTYIKKMKEHRYYIRGFSLILFFQGNHGKELSGSYYAIVNGTRENIHTKPLGLITDSTSRAIW